MLWFHPIFQALVTLLAPYVLWLGWQRFKSAHLGREAVFPWKRHVLLGKTVTLLWLAGGVGGAVMARLARGTWLESHHVNGALVMTVFILISLTTGLIMDRNRTQRTVLPLIHGVSGVLLVAASLYQAADGLEMVSHLLLGR